MTDELTPEEKKAMSGLPRERMPAGLEARVVESMRDRGFLEKRRRTIDLTNSRVTGLLAACVALMIGAYSIGLHRGGSDPLLPGVATMERKDRDRAEKSVIDAMEKKANRPAPGDAIEAEPPASEMARKKDVLTFDETRQELAGQVVPNEPTADRDDQFEAKQTGLVVRGVREMAAKPPAKTSAPQALEEESVGRVQALRSRAAPETQALSQRPFTFLLNGKPVVVDAPDSVRVTQDDSGRILLIYTSDGIIRIRLADDD